MHAQTIKITEGEADFRIEKNITEEQAVNKAKEKAKINAIENAFGSFVSEGNSLYVKNTNTGSKQKSDQVFSSISNILVNGEWIQTIDEKQSFYESEGARWVKITIKGKVRELNKTPFTPESYTLSCENLKCSTEVFNNGQSLFVYFKAPRDGFISIYLDDNKEVQRLLPYSNTPTLNSYNVKADQEYYFFSNQVNNKNTDQIELFTNESIEQNQLIVLYSVEDFTKPNLNRNESKDSNIQMPISLPSNSFYNWLQKSRAFNRNIELQSTILTIKK